MPLKMTMMFKKYIITLQISNSKLKKSVLWQISLTNKFVKKVYLVLTVRQKKSKYLLAQFWFCLASH